MKSFNLIEEVILSGLLFAKTASPVRDETGVGLDDPKRSVLINPVAFVDAAPLRACDQSSVKRVVVD